MFNRQSLMSLLIFPPPQNDTISSSVPNPMSCQQVYTFIVLETEKDVKVFESQKIYGQSKTVCLNITS